MKRVKSALQWLSEDPSFLSVVAVISIYIALILYALYSLMEFGFTFIETEELKLLYPNA